MRMAMARRACPSWSSPSGILGLDRERFEAHTLRLACIYHDFTLCLALSCSSLKAFKARIACYDGALGPSYEGYMIGMASWRTCC